MDQYIRKYDRLTRKYERIYTKKFYRILRQQVEQYIKTKNIDSIQSDMVADALLELYLKAGGEWAFYVERQLRKDKVIKRLPFSFNLRISRLIRNQFTPDILNMANNITQTTKDRIRTVLRDNLGASFDDIVKILRSPELTAARARLIARTETVGATNGAAMENAKAFVIPMRKRWSAVLDGRTRKDHETLDGHTVGMNEKFSVVDKDGITRQMNFPGDKEGGPGQVCNCRCVVVFVQGGAEPAPIPIERPSVQEPPQPVAENIEAKSIAEAKEIAKRLMNQIENINIASVTVSRDLSLENFNKRNAQIQKLNNKYNLLTKNIGLTKLLFRSTNSSYGFVRAKTNDQIVDINFGHKTGEWKPASERAEIVRYTPDKPETFIKLANKSNVDKENIEIATLTHEYAHLITMSRAVNPTVKELHNRFWSEIKSVRSEYIQELRIAMEAKNEQALDTIFLGSYASTNADEFFAEAFKEYELSSTPSPFAIKVGNIVKKYFSKNAAD